MPYNWVGGISTAFGKTDFLVGWFENTTIYYEDFTLFFSGQTASSFEQNPDPMEVGNTINKPTDRFTVFLMCVKPVVRCQYEQWKRFYLAVIIPPVHTIKRSPSNVLISSNVSNTNDRKMSECGSEAGAASSTVCFLSAQSSKEDPPDFSMKRKKEEKRWDFSLGLCQ